MERRKFVIGLGSLAAGGAAATGTGAFTETTAERDGEINIQNDANAFLGIKPGQYPNSQYVKTGGTGNSAEGEVYIEMNGNSPGAGSGVNINATTTYDSMLQVTNQAGARKEVWITHSSFNNRVTGFMDDEDVIIYPSGGQADRSSDVPDHSAANMESSSNAVSLAPGQSVFVGLYFDTTGADKNNDPTTDEGGSSRGGYGQFIRSITVNAEDV